MDMSDEQPAQFSAEQLGEYTIVRDIAEGTFGKVKSAPLSIQFTQKE